MSLHKRPTGGLLLAAALVTVCVSLASCGRAAGLKGVIDDVARGLGVGARALETRAGRLVATGKVTEEALAAALPVAQSEAGQWDRLAADLAARIRLKAQGSVNEVTLQKVLHGTACDAFMKAFDGETPDFATLIRNNALLVLLPGQVEELVAASGLVQDTYDRLKSGVHPKVALDAARATVACARAGRD